MPTRRNLLLYMTVSLLILVLSTGYMREQIDEFRTANQVTIPFIEGFYSSVSDTLNQDTTFGKLSVGLIWGAIGAVVYILFWMAGNALSEMRNIVVEELFYVKPKADSLWHGRILLFVQTLYRMGLIVLIACFVMAVISITLPFSRQSAQLAMAGSPQPIDAVIALASLLILIVSMHSVVILVRLLVIRDTLSRHVRKSG